MADQPARVRIAPSPTGDPHVGTAYMALFNKALADKTDGQFLLRIEDTDRTRYVADSEKQIFEALRWLGLNYHEGPDVGGPVGPYRQSERLPLYKDAAEQLVASGKAYKCFCTNERLEALRKIQQAEKSKHQGYDGLCRSLSPEEVARNEREGKPYVIRLKMPREGDIVVADKFRGSVSFPASDQQDAVLLKSDGFPTYHLANIVDDHAMGITHVIRAEEWIASLPLHHELYKAFGWQEPVFAHMPLLRNKDKSKISKRKNPTSLLWYRDAGFMPEALVNFLSLMGFSMPNDVEIFSYDSFLSEFSLDKVNLGGPVFNLEKLLWLNGEYLRRLPPEALAERIYNHVKLLMGREREFADVPEEEQPKDTFLKDFEQKRRRWSRRLAELAPVLMRAYEHQRGMFLSVMPLVTERLHTLCEAADYLPMFFVSDFALKPEDFAGKKTSPADAKKALVAMREIVSRLDFAQSGAKETLDAEGRTRAEGLGLKVGDFFAPARVAITGARVSPPLIESMIVLGPSETLSRLDRAIALLP
ncbi:MAG TPA: glutamate--tRNA ligase [Planctomycetota bacterium]|nr:glutamate--tRNA ligase [Planctomycetota bacterium]